jgi:integrase
LHSAKQQISPGSINAAIAALRFFFTVTLERPDLVRPLTIVNKPRKAPVVLSEEEVARLLEAAPSLKYKAALSVAYGAGLRVSEVANLKVSDIDSQRMTLRVEQGKGQRDRYVMLSPQLLELLRDWWRAARPQACQPLPGSHISPCSKALGWGSCSMIRRCQGRPIQCWPRACLHRAPAQPRQPWRRAHHLQKFASER